MPWKNGYFYQQHWENGTCRSEYVGAGYGAMLAEHELAQRQAEREAFRREAAQQQALDAQVEELQGLARSMATLVLVATGHYTHRGQWRCSRMGKTLQVTLQKPTAIDLLSVDELNLLIRGLDSANPTREQRAEFLRYLDLMPVLARHMGSTQEPIIAKTIESMHGAATTAASLAAQVHLENMRKSMNYDKASVHEKGLIDNVCICWIRLQSAEWRHMHATAGDHSVRVGLYWERVLSATQARYLRACETLARVRRLNVSVQINMANQQIVTG